MRLDHLDEFQVETDIKNFTLWIGGYSLRHGHVVVFDNPISHSLPGMETRRACVSKLVLLDFVKRDCH